MGFVVAVSAFELQSQDCELLSRFSARTRNSPQTNTGLSSVA